MLSVRLFGHAETVSGGTPMNENNFLKYKTTFRGIICSWILVALCTHKFFAGTTDLAEQY